MTHLEAFVYRGALTHGIRRLLAIARNTPIGSWAIAASDGWAMARNRGADRNSRTDPSCAIPMV
jgi:hypothetical protein